MGYVGYPSYLEGKFNKYDDAPMVVPVSDEAVYNHFTDTERFFNKYWLAQKEGIDCGLCTPETAPKNFPVVVRPAYNLSGLSKGAEIWESEDDVRDLPGYFWSEKLGGEHYSIDMIVRGNKVFWAAMFQCHYHEEQALLPDRWELFAEGSLKGSEYHEDLTAILRRMRSIGAFYKREEAVVNIECFYDPEKNTYTVFEVHQRLSPQFVDFYPKGFLFFPLVINSGSLSGLHEWLSGNDDIDEGHSKVFWLDRELDVCERVNIFNTIKNFKNSKYYNSDEGLLEVYFPEADHVGVGGKRLVCIINCNDWDVLKIIIDHVENIIKNYEGSSRIETV
jgi:hypothetical protein